MKHLAVTTLAVLLAACGGGKPVRTTTTPAPPEASMQHRAGSARTAPRPAATPANYPARVTRARPDKPGEYTAGGLYKPGVPDGGPAIPPDVSHLVEPEPTDEPPARYGNRSPYTVLGKRYHVMESADGYVARGIASWYGSKFHGRATSSLEPYDMYQFSAAHKSLPLPSHVRVTNLENGRSVVVRVNDRGPFHEDRLIDLSYAAAVKLGVHINGTAPVEVRALKPGQIPPPAPPAMPATQAWAAARAGHAGNTRRRGNPVQIAAIAPARATPPAPPPARSRTHTPAPRPTTHDKVWLQVASFGESDNANRLVGRLENAGLMPSVQRAHIDGRTVYRVRVGPFASREKSKATSDRLHRMGLGVPTLIAE